MLDTATETKHVVKVVGLHHAGIPCNDMQRAIDFYTSVLGFEVNLVVPDSDWVPHFLDRRVPREQGEAANPEWKADYEEFLDDLQQAKGKPTQMNIARLQGGSLSIVLFQRPTPIEGETLMDNGIFHQSFYVSREDMDRLVEMKRRGDSGIRFHTGPVTRKEGRAMYLWDSEGNYLELEETDEAAHH